ncbi:MAG: DNA polymerase I [Deltaproteobacteria bacterium]|nr:DNA polymerase I [Deltaproteobacteria bacterium]
MDRIHILDGHGYVFRAHFGLMGSSRNERREVRLSTSEGMPTGALYVFARMLIRLHEDLHPERIAVVFDAGRKSFRTEIFPEYKAHRPPPPEDLAIQMPYFRQIVEGMRWPVLAVPGVEADDVIATLVTQARAKGWEAVVYSADKDLMQLVGDGVTMIDALRATTYTREEVMKKFGVPPEQVADFLALTGDTSDNIPGLSGVGDKTAATLLATYGSIERMIEENPVVPRLKIRQPFGDPEQLERVRMSRKLVELDRAVALPTPLEELKAEPWDTQALTKLFGELEFQLLVDKVARVENGTDGPAPTAEGVAPAKGKGKGKKAKAAADDAPAAPAEPLPMAAGPAPTIASDAAAIAELAAAIRAAGRCAVIALADGQRVDRAHAIGVAIAIEGASWYVPLGHRYLGAPAAFAAADLAPLAAVLTDPAVAIVAHDGKRDGHALAAVGLTLGPSADDTMIAAFLLDSTIDAEAVETVIGQAAGVTLAGRAAHLGKAKTFEGVQVVEAAAWTAPLASAALAAATAQGHALAKAGLTSLYKDVELPVARILADLERTGIMIDADHFRALAGRTQDQLVALERTIFDALGEECNLGSPKQLGHILFDKLGLVSERMKKTKTGHSVDHDVLEGLIGQHPAIAPILEHRELSKLKGTYLDALPPLVNPRTGRLHTTFNQVAAATGRISSQDPNLQNIPIRTEIGREIRRGFIAAPGRVLIAADYSQIELRILAHLSGDPLLSKAFRDRVDVHTQTAAMVFGIPLEEVGARERRVAKAVNYGLIYGQSDFGLARALDVSRNEAHDYAQRYFERLPTVRKFMEDIVTKARKAGGAHTLLGRWRPIPDLSSKSPMARRQAERIAQNTPLQGAGADIIKLAMIATTRRLAAMHAPAVMLLTVHDELIFEVPPDRADEAAAAIKEEMEAVAPNGKLLDVPLEVDVGIAATWADA